VDIFRRGEEIVLRESARGLTRAFEILANLPDDYLPEVGNSRKSEKSSE